MKELKFFVPLTKVDIEKREVWGLMAEEKPDETGEVFDYATSKPNVLKWSKYIEEISGGKSKGNLRVMHQLETGGKVVDIQFDDDLKKIYIGAKVTNDKAWEDVQNGVLNGFSIGGSYANVWNKNGYKYYTAIPTEVSLCDSPCYSGAIFDIIKTKKGEETLKRLFKTINGDMSYEDLRCKIQEAIDNNLNGKISTPTEIMQGGWIIETYPDCVIINVYSSSDEKKYRVYYTVENDKVTLGDYEEIEILYQVKGQNVKQEQEDMQKATNEQVEINLNAKNEGEKKDTTKPTGDITTGWGNTIVVRPDYAIVEDEYGQLHKVPYKKSDDGSVSFGSSQRIDKACDEVNKTDGKMKKAEESEDLESEVKEPPLENKEQAIATIEYWSRKENRDKYSAEEQAKIEEAIKEAKEKFGLNEEMKKAEDNQEEVSKEEELKKQEEKDKEIEEMKKSLITLQKEIEMLKAMPINDNLPIRVSNASKLTEQDLLKSMINKEVNPKTREILSFKLTQMQVQDIFKK